MDPRPFLARGDVVRIEIEGLGAIEHTVRSMRARYGVAAAFAVAIVGGLIVLRDQGYLRGRVEGGPLRIASRRHRRRRAAPDRRASGSTLDAGGRRRASSSGCARGSSRPGCDVLGPRRHGRRAAAVCAIARWPPAGTDARCAARRCATREPEALLGLRAERPGVYYVHGLVADYRRGQRRYRDREPQRLCVSTSRRQRCDSGYRADPRGGRRERLPVVVEVGEHVELGAARARRTRSAHASSSVAE